MSDDPELAAIRAKRLSELRSSPHQQIQSQPAQEHSQQQDDEFRHTILSRILTTEARQRCILLSLLIFSGSYING